MNGFALATGFAAAVELVLGGAAAVIALRGATRAATRGRGGGDGGLAADGDAGADSDPAAGTSPAALRTTMLRLGAVALASAPLLWLHLSDLAAETPGVMCVQGVLQMGSRAGGAAAWLPALLAASVAAKAVALLAAGAWLAVETADRATAAGPLARRALLIAALAGAAAAADGAAQIAHLLVPPGADPGAAGCCAMDVSTAFADVSGPATPDATRGAWTLAAFAGLAAMTLLAAAGPPRRAAGWTALTVGAAATVVAAGGLAVHALAPARLGLAFHECGFCLLRDAPETWIGAALLAAATGCVTWAVAAAAAARGTAAAGAAHDLGARLLRLAALGYAGTAVVAAVERWAL